MFSHAIALAGEYTRPIIVTKRTEDQTVSCGMATFIVINESGWILTAAHVVQDALVAQQHKVERDKYQSDILAINSNPQYSPGKKKHEIGQLNKNWEWITHFSMWWAIDGITAEVLHIDGLTDLALAKLIGPTDKLQVKAFPIFANPSNPIQQGTSLCRLGFPFHYVKALFDSATEKFSIPDLPPLARFPNDGIFTRNMMLVDNTTKQQVHFIETSSPGLRGQSGGPIFDTKGNVWALQSRTSHLALGFTPKVKHDGKESVEHQIMNVGLGVYVSHIRDIFSKFDVKFQSA